MGASENDCGSAFAGPRSFLLGLCVFISRSFGLDGLTITMLIK